MALELGVDQIQEHLDKFSKLPRAYRMAVVPVLVALVLGGYGYLFYSPAQAELAQVQTQEQQLQRKVSEVRSIVSNLAVFEQELGQLEVKLKHALRQLPDSKELPVLLTDISSLGKDAGLEFKAFRPRDEVQRGFYAEVPIEIEFTGSFHDVARFFDRVSRLPRIVNVGRLEMGILQQGPEGTRLRVSGEATTFRFIERDPVKKAGGAGTKGGTRS